MLRIFGKLRKADLGYIGIAILFIVAQVWLDLKMPDYISEITVLVQTPGSAMKDVWMAGGKMLACAFGSLISAMAVSITAARIATDFGADLRKAMFSKVQKFSMEEIGKFSTPSLITRSINDIQQVQMLIIFGLQALIKAPIMATWAITKISGKNETWTFTTAAAVGILLCIVIVSMIVVLPKFKKLQRMTDDLNRVTRENLSGIRVVRAYNAEDYQEAKFDKVNNELTATHLFTGKAMAFMMPAISMVMNGLTLAIYWLGAIMINEAQMMDKITLFSDMIVFTQYAMQVVMSFMMLVMIFIIMPRASVSAKRILEVLDTKLSITDGSRKTDANGQTGSAQGVAEQGITGQSGTEQGTVEFRNVSFKYPDAEDYVLENITFKANKGETVAIIGATGCGKSTTINMIPRFYDATEGEVLVDGINVKEYTQKDLRNKIGYVSQKAILFSGNIYDNIAYGDNGKESPDEADVAAAAATAQAADFIEEKQDKYDAHVAQGGSNFSGGQKQRISIARAICRKPEIFIFDDSFSALDYKTDKVLRNQLKEDCKDATKLIVAQRIGTIRDADQIIVLEDGRIVGKGKHDELMKNCETYQQIAYSQLSKEELA